MAQPIIVPLLPGADTLTIPTGPQLSGKHVLTGTDGTRAVFNDPTDADYVGVLTSFSGIDTPEIRESADNLVQLDGGVHGDFYFGRRPMTLEGIILNPLSPDDRNRKMTRIKRAGLALRSDATLQWRLDGGYEQFVRIRAQNGIRFEGNWQKTFNIGMVAADPRIYGLSQYTMNATISQNIAAGGTTLTQVGTFNIPNSGNFEAPLLFVIKGPISNPVISNTSNGERFTFNGTLSSNETLTIDMKERLVTSSLTGPRYGEVDFGLTSWLAADPGQNNMILAAKSNPAGSGLTVYWRDTWI